MPDVYVNLLMIVHVFSLMVDAPLVARMFLDSLCTSDTVANHDGELIRMRIRIRSSADSSVLERVNSSKKSHYSQRLAKPVRMF